ncbi:putative methyltransferase DDB_G0268948 [Uloborus diversus]|uniref:putative methyltransferase DDB_G0268948 n=1 Tax=Uloborus diversus TaxID=327109 RepID=UPI002409FF6A|nr:putative methyltransferase DDB_G0268948 [Uloborus diversus]XP_054715795.1 putative methyltransferase DDB_G0268948 [Uloborus diversus]
MVNQQFADQYHAEIYSAFRPNIPTVLAEKIKSSLKEEYHGSLDRAVDVGCGSGQSTIILADHFRKVWGIDASEAQIHEANNSRTHPNITYVSAPAEILPFRDQSVQLVTAAACLHWFQMDIFFSEVRRVLVHNGIFAAYTYHSLRPIVIDAVWKTQVDLVFDQIYEELHPYWSAEVLISLEKYETIEFPFGKVSRIPDVKQIFSGRFSDIIGFIESLSAYQNMRKEDSEKAEALISTFSFRLKEILEAAGICCNDTMKLYRTFFPIICRKTEV